MQRTGLLPPPIQSEVFFVTTTYLAQYLFAGLLPLALLG